MQAACADPGLCLFRAGSPVGPTMAHAPSRASSGGTSTMVRHCNSVVRGAYARGTDPHCRAAAGSGLHSEGVRSDRATPTHTHAPAPAGSSSSVRREGRNVSLRHVRVCYGHVSRRANHLVRLGIRLRIRPPWVPSLASLTQGATHSQASLVSKPAEAPVPDTQPLFDQRLPLVREAP